MRTFIHRLHADFRDDPDVAMLMGIVMAGEAIAVTVCLYFAATLPLQNLH